MSALLAAENMELIQVEVSEAELDEMIKRTGRPVQIQFALF